MPHRVYVPVDLSEIINCIFLFFMKNILYPYITKLQILDKSYKFVCAEDLHRFFKHDLEL